jgi:hypothetical protein
MIASIMSITSRLYKLLLASLITTFLCFTIAQDTPTSTKDTEPAPPGDSATPAEETTANDGQYLVVNELQRDVFGVVFRGSYTPTNGFYAGLAGRFYTPIPVPVPTFVSIGAGFASTGANIAATFGAHIPFGLNSPARATLEAGLGYEGGENAGFRFVASLGVGYVFYVDTAPISDQERKRRELARLEYCAEDKITEPNPDTLEEAFDLALEDFLDRARAQYAGTYSGLNYDLDPVSQEINGVEAVIVRDFSGSVTVKATGKKERASGTITARFGWTGCSWKLLDYNVN